MTASVSAAAFHGAETPLRAAPGVRVFRVEHPPEQRVEAHDHDWACLTVFRCGGYTEQTTAEEVTIDAPAVVFHPGGAQHTNRIGALGLETMSFLFDPSLLRDVVPAKSLHEGRIWLGGTVARAARTLLRDVANPTADPAISIARFLSSALFAAQRTRNPSWLQTARCAIADEAVSTSHLARRLNLHSAWLARAYLHAMGESIQATIRRHRVERALALVRGTELSLARIAAESGFCDQSHMVRCFHAVMGRGPSRIRAESDRVA